MKENMQVLSESIDGDKCTRKVCVQLKVMQLSYAKCRQAKDGE